MRVRLKVDQLLEHVARSTLSQNHWAMKVGLSRGHWSEIVNGKHPYPSPKTRQRLLDQLGLPFEQLFEVESGPALCDAGFQAAIAARWVVDQEIGQGGMGTVYLARDLQLGRLVAIKVISPEVVSGIGTAQFMREIAYIARLQHPHILPLFEAGQGAGYPYYVMPYLREGSLRDLLVREARLPLAQALSITRQIAAALAHAHRHRILHCDMKPGNILMHEGHAYVADFGIARAIHAEAAEWGRRREVDSSAGTPAYVSPEQASGEPELDGRADLYSLASMIFEMLAGRPPFVGDSTLHVVSQRFTDPVPPLRSLVPDLPADVEYVIEQALAVDRDDRQHDVDQFANDLELASRPSLRGAARILSRGANRALRHVNRRLGPGVAGRLGGFMHAVIQQAFEFRRAARRLSKQPGFVAAAAGTLALGIGATTAIFSVVYGVMLKPLPFQAPERLVGLYHRGPGYNLAVMNQGPATYFTYLDHQRAFEGIGAWDRQEVSITGRGEPERVQALAVTHATLPLLRVPPLLGRLFTEADDRPGSPLRVVLTHGYWQRKFGGAPDVIGHLLEIDGVPGEVIGVVPASFRFLRSDPAVLLPLQPDRAVMWVSFGFQALARLRPGVTLAQANADVARMIPLLDPIPGYAKIRLEPNVRPLAQDVIGGVGRILWILLGTVGIVLLIACANVANLFLVRAEARQQELAIRAALGASRGRIARELLSESLLLGLAGGAVGLLLARAGIGLLRRLAPVTLPRADEIALDPAVLLFTVAVSLLTGLL